MKTLLRLLRHRAVDERDSRRALDDGALDRLQEQIRQSEQHHSGEIRIVVEAGLPWSYLRRALGARERAVTLFGKLRVWDTEHNNGVLVYLLLAERAIEIVADRGVARVATPQHWKDVIDGMRAAFREGRFESGLSAAVTSVDQVLRAHFPVGPGEVNPNELPDRPLRL